MIKSTCACADVYEVGSSRSADPEGSAMSAQVRPARSGPGRRRHHRLPVVHLLLARRGHRPRRPRLVRVLRRRHRRAGRRQGGALVHPRRHALLVRRSGDLHRELDHVRPRRRLPRRQGGDGRDAGQAVGVGAAVRLRPHRADQRDVGRTVHRRPPERPVAPSSDRRFHLPPNETSAVLARSSSSTSGGATRRVSASRAATRCASCRSRR